MPCGWGVKAPKVWFVCGWQVKLCDHLVTYGLYLSALEMHRDRALHKFTLLSPAWLVSSSQWYGTALQLAGCKILSNILFGVMFWRLELPSYKCNLPCIDENRPAPVTTSCDDNARSRQILISYVRAEAAEHALRLKHSLTHRGFDVFLVCCVKWPCSVNCY